MNLTSGEIRALASGKEIISNEQLAVCYLVAHHNVLNSNINFGVNINHDDLSVEIGMNPETYRRTVNKFKLILEDRHEDVEYTKSEIIYQKILKAYNVFINNEYQNVYNIAKQAFSIEAKELGQKLKEEFLEKQKKYYTKAVQEKKSLDKKIEFAFLDLYKSLIKFKAKDQAEKIALLKISKEFNVDLSSVKKKCEKLIRF